MRGRQRTERIEKCTCETWKGMGGKREPGASVGAAWIHVAEPTEPHIQNDAAVDLAMPMIVYGLTSITMSGRRYSLCGPRPYAIVKWHNVSFSLTSYK